jgi:transcriptional regulator with XRE-family HTH domain
MHLTATTPRSQKREFMLINDNSFSSKLNHLFEENRKPDGTRYSQKEVIESAPGILSRVYLWRLRTGKASRPSYRVVKALADFFGVDPTYFFPDDDLSTLDTPHSDLTQQIALRSAGLDEDGQRTVLMMIEAIKKSKSDK